jgi:hypothetical protein
MVTVKEAESLGSALATLEATISAQVSDSGEGARVLAEAVYAAADLFAITPGGKEGAAAWREWCEQLTTADGSPIPLTRSAVSKMGTVLKYLPADRARAAPWTRQYLASRAVKEGLLGGEEAADLAESLSESALRREVWGDKEEAAPTQYVCRSCGATGTKTDLIEEVAE